MEFYHYTCHHGRLALGDRGMVRPLRETSPLTALKLGTHLWLADVSWFTDLEHPWRSALGLTARLLTTCDRGAFRYRVTDHSSLVMWVEVYRELAPPRDAVRLNFAPGAMPMHWWLSVEPVPVVYDPLPDV